ncbi:MAG: nucleotidyltransferase family protein [Candidatus Omnitrophica bacterium]|nr:nucleotidyltransferase family protein [Candidatus Omnitrophota bacterium]
MHTNLGAFCVGPDCSFREAVRHIDENGLGIVLVVDPERRLLGTITDGDARRAILANVNLEAPVAALLALKAGSRHARPVTARVGTDRETCVRLMRSHGILHLPLLDAQERVAGVVRLNDFVQEGPLPTLQAVVMAGGAGRRLSPLTDETPKPMLPIGDRPLLEIIIEQLREAGITQVKVTTHHKPEKIVEHFGDGKEFGVELSYMEEDRPLGTAGALGLLAAPTTTTLVVCGDILTQVDYRTLVAYHRGHQAELTMVVRPHDLKVPYGVVECDGPLVRRVREKPVLNLFVNAGIYLLEPSAFTDIPKAQRFDMTDLIQSLLDAGRRVVSFPLYEFWLDIGQHADYREAQEQVKTWKSS